MSLYDWFTERAGSPNARGTAFGDDPARIYAYFHAGPGTGAYQHAQHSAKTLHSALGGHVDDLHAAERALGGGWQGAAAAAARAALAPLRDRFGAMSAHAGGGASQLDAQLSSFGDTKNKVVPVSGPPPRGGGLATVTDPLTMVREVNADAVVTGYQQAARINQQAYAAYTAATRPQAAALSGSSAPAAVPGNPPTPARSAEPGSASSYLVREQEGNAIVGDIPPVAPPVIE